MPYMLSTSDNPYDPVTQWDEWRQFDESNGYNTNAYLARVAHVSNELSKEDYSLAVEHAINEIVEINVTGNYIKVKVPE